MIRPSLLQQIRVLPLNFSRLAPLVLIAIWIIAIIVFNTNGHPRNYLYEKRMAPNGVELHLIRTTPDNIRLQAIETNVTNTPYYGINGGFFWEGALLSIAVVDDRPLKGMPGDYGSGWYNTGIKDYLKRGTLVWDDADKRFSVQAVAQAGELVVRDKLHYWAQGGVSMNLSNESRWQEAMIKEEMPSYDEGHMRSGIVYDRQQHVYMIVTTTLCTIEQFRTAILEAMSDYRLVDGIFLDGDGSSQLQCKDVTLQGDKRPVFQMLSLKR